MAAYTLEDTPAPTGGGLMTISDEEFALLRGLIYQRFGINLTEQKRSLLVGRLQKTLRQQGIDSFRAYHEYLVTDRSESGLSELVDLISTNHTYFNREAAHFEFFQKTALPQAIQALRSKGRKDLRIWCAGCSTGEEPYTLQMLMLEVLGADYRNWDAGILATDISDRALSIARQGVYPNERVQALPEALRRKYFRKVDGDNWEVAAEVKKEVLFRRLNLMNSSFPFKKPFQIIFCRNVMIYFDQPTRDALVQRFCNATEPQGYLFIGHSETLGRKQGIYDYIQPALYRKGGA